jgi:hypothetical protein
MNEITRAGSCHKETSSSVQRRVASATSTDSFQMLDACHLSVSWCDNADPTAGAELY